MTKAQKHMATYNGSNLLRIDGLGLYAYDNINHEATMASVLAAFDSTYKKSLIAAAKKLGLKYVGAEYYSPREYNFQNDTIDLTFEVKSKALFKPYVLGLKKLIDEQLRANKSYDGYMALTVSSVDEELERVEKDNYTPDIIVLGVILQNMIDFKSFTPAEYYEYDDEDEVTA